MTHRGARYFFLLLALVAAVQAGDNLWAEGDSPPMPPTGESSPATPLRNDDLHQLFELGEGLYSGAQPEDEDSFAVLDSLGVKTIISVDGSTPDVELAHQHGIRYVHLPIGYDGIEPEQAARIVQAASELPGPIYIHCHHGKHRGPAAAAVVCRALQGWTAEQAQAWMEQAGTSPDYAGLFESVAAFEPPTAEELAALPADFPEQAEVPDLIAAMVEVDRYFEHLKQVRQAEYGVPDDHPDLDPPHEALQLSEQFREILRKPETPDHGEEFVLWMAEAEEKSAQLSELLKADASARDAAWQAAAEAAFSDLSRQCTQCHHRYRDPGEGSALPSPE